MSALRIASTTSAVGAASLSIAKPTGAVAGDVVIVFATATCASGTPATLGTMSGWTATANTQGSNTSFAARGYAIVLTGSESWPFAITSNGSVSLAFIADYSGASNFDPTTLVAPLYSNGSGTPTASSMTLANSGDWIAWFGVASKNGTPASNPVTIPTGYANATDSGLKTNSLQGARGSFGDLETAQASGATGTISGSVTSQVNWGWACGIQLGATTLLSGVPAAITTAAPAGTENVAWNAGPAPVTVTAPPGGMNEKWAGAVAAITMTAPAGAMSNLQALTGVPATISLAAPVGGFNVKWQGAVAAIQTGAPAGALHASTALLGTTAAIQMTAFAGGLNNVSPVYNNPWYENQLDPLDSDFQGPTVP